MTDGVLCVVGLAVVLVAGLVDGLGVVVASVLVANTSVVVGCVTVVVVPLVVVVTASTVVVRVGGVDGVPSAVGLCKVLRLHSP